MSERSEQRCFEIMNMNDKTFIFSPDAPSGFFSRIFSGKNFSKFFSKIFFSRIFSGKNFSKFFSKIFFSRIFSGIFFHNFFHQIFSAEYFFRITQRNPRIEFIGISFPFNQGFLFLLVAANNFFNSKNILICLLQFCFVK